MWGFDRANSSVAACCSLMCQGMVAYTSSKAVERGALGTLEASSRAAITFGGLCGLMQAGRGAVGWGWFRFRFRSHQTS